MSLACNARTAVVVGAALLALTNPGAGAAADDRQAPARSGDYWARVERLDRRGSRLRRGLSPQDVRRVLGAPRQRVEWKDIRFHNKVMLWVYATSDSGTAAWSAVFANGCLDEFGVAQQSHTWYRYGRPGWSYPDPDAKDYRFSSAGERVCATSGGSGSP